MMALSRRSMKPRNKRPPLTLEARVRDLTEQFVAAARGTEGDINHKLESIMRTLDEVLDVVTAQRSRIASLAALVSGVKKQVDDALGGQLTPSQQQRVDRIFNELQTNTQQIDQAIDANDGDNPDQGGEGDKPKGEGESEDPDPATETRITVSSSNAYANVGEAITLSAAVEAMVSSAARNVDPVSGAVVFNVDGEAVGTATLDSTGVAAISSSEFAGGGLKEGDHEITARYQGKGKFAPSDSEPLTQTMVVPEGNPGGKTFEDIKAEAGSAGQANLDGAGQRNELPADAPQGPTPEWPGDPNNFGQPTTQTRNTRPGLPDTPGVPNAGASAAGGSATPPGQVTNAPGETRSVDPQGNPVMPRNTVEDVHSGAQRGALPDAGNPKEGESWTGGSALHPGGSKPAVTTRDGDPHAQPDVGPNPANPRAQPTAASPTAVSQDPAAQGNEVGGNLSGDPIGVSAGTVQRDDPGGLGVTKSNLGPDFQPQQGNPQVVGDAYAKGDKQPPAGGGKASN
jgi:hypothetical protein